MEQRLDSKGVVDRKGVARTGKRGMTHGKTVETFDNPSISTHCTRSVYKLLLLES